MASLLSRQSRPSIFSSDTASFVCRTCRRNAASSRRTRKALRVKTDPSFEPPKTETQDHIIFNPPSSAPNVYHTPAKFLPKSDPRRALYTTAAAAPTDSPSSKGGILASIAASRASSTPSASQLKPVRPQYEKKYHLSQEDIEEIRRLRKQDPRTWTRVRLAEKFECSQFFVSLCCSAPEIKEEREAELERIKSKWGRKKREARDLRQERKKLWGRDV